MSEFQQGLVSLPLVILVLAAAVCAVLGAWVIAEKWVDHRFAVAQKAKLGEDIGGKIRLRTVSQLGRRKPVATTILVASTVRTARVFGGRFLVYVKIGNDVDMVTKRRLELALQKAVDDEAVIAESEKDS